MTFKEDQNYIVVKDHSVSKETFSLVYNKEYDILKTQPFPALENLGKYYESDNYISHTDSKEGFIDKVYQWVRSYTLQSKIRLLTSLQPQKGKLLDIGCGTGDFLKVAQQNRWEAYGFEPSEKARNISKSKNINVLEDLFALENHSFDAITMWHVLEHVPNIEEYISNLKRILKPNGVLLIAVPNYKSFDALYYKQYWAAYDVPRHLWHFSKISIKRLFSDVDMKLLHVKPMWFDSFYVSLLSEKYKKRNFAWFRAFSIGFLSNVSGSIKKEYSSHIYILKNN